MARKLWALITLALFSLLGGIGTAFAADYDFTMSIGDMPDQRNNVAPFYASVDGQYLIVDAKYDGFHHCIARMEGHKNPGNETCVTLRGSGKFRKSNVDFAIDHDLFNDGRLKDVRVAEVEFTCKLPKDVPSKIDISGFHVKVSFACNLIPEDFQQELGYVKEYLIKNQAALSDPNCRESSKQMENCLIILQMFSARDESENRVAGLTNSFSCRTKVCTHPSAPGCSGPIGFPTRAIQFDQERAEMVRARVQADLRNQPPCTYTDRGLRNGHCVDYRDKERKLINSRCTYKDGKRHGKCEFYSYLNDGALCITTTFFDDDKEDGENTYICKKNNKVTSSKRSIYQAGQFTFSESVVPQKDGSTCTHTRTYKLDEKTEEHTTVCTKGDTLVSRTRSIIRDGKLAYDESSSIEENGNLCTSISTFDKDVKKEEINTCKKGDAVISAKRSTFQDGKLVSSESSSTRKDGTLCVRTSTFDNDKNKEKTEVCKKADSVVSRTQSIYQDGKVVSSVSISNREDGTVCTLNTTYENGQEKEEVRTCKKGSEIVTNSRSTFQEGQPVFYESRASEQKDLIFRCHYEKNGNPKKDACGTYFENGVLAIENHFHPNGDTTFRTYVPSGGLASVSYIQKKKNFGKAIHFGPLRNNLWNGYADIPARILDAPWSTVTFQPSAMTQTGPSVSKFTYVENRDGKWLLCTASIQFPGRPAPGKERDKPKEISEKCEPADERSRDVQFHLTPTDRQMTTKKF